MQAGAGLMQCSRDGADTGVVRRPAALAREVNENVELAIFRAREVAAADQIASPQRLVGVP
jgi:hypothetical protein